MVVRLCLVSEGVAHMQKGWPSSLVFSMCLDDSAAKPDSNKCFLRQPAEVFICSPSAAVFICNRSFAVQLQQQKWQQKNSFAIV